MKIWVLKAVWRERASLLRVSRVGHWLGWNCGEARVFRLLATVMRRGSKWPDSGDKWFTRVKRF